MEQHLPEVKWPSLSKILHPGTHGQTNIRCITCRRRLPFGKPLHKSTSYIQIHHTCCEAIVIGRRRIGGGVPLGAHVVWTAMLFHRKSFATPPPSVESSEALLPLTPSQNWRHLLRRLIGVLVCSSTYMNVLVSTESSMCNQSS